MNPLLVVCVLFFISLFAAWILFRFLKSTAIVRNKQYQAGGALAGFLIVFSATYVSYVKISDFQGEINRYKQLVDGLNTTIKENQDFIAARYIEGTVDPYSSQTKIVLAIAEADLPVNKKFRIASPCVDLKKGKYALYVIQEGRNFPYEIFPDENISDLKIEVPQH
jgi:hypothetical protein